MNVSLTPELEKLVQAKVRTGRYNSASEVVREALRLLEQQDSLRAIHLKELCSRIDEGLTSLDRGQGTDGEKFMQGMLHDLASRKARPKA
ncbi:MAG: type II toxin-antitoxin system ParD family antitoxin, partial [Acidobacteriota bacterium]|nr:type II toxin-antitoxin system ParD family antitoxin [Acidobacteriota bacterium]